MFYICIPRNKRALQRLKNDYAKRSKFKIIPKTKRSATQIHWKHSMKATSFIKVKSPLSKYLDLQRRNMVTKGEWTRVLSNIIAKDYAVLARFKRTDRLPSMIEGSLKDYFLGGIRGLGTWGAGWFIDRKYDHFMKYEDDEDIQLLLEVEYRDGRIYDVRDVSEEEQAYFDKQNNLKTIRKIIKDYRSM